jgi:hypothetical protein
MPSTESESPDDSFFNDLARSADQNDNGQDAQNDASSKVKRIACVLCRKRKLKCDGSRPTCGTCKRLSHDCAYDEVRKKSGPKRGYVKLLEQRLRKLASTIQSAPTDMNRNRASRTPLKESGYPRHEQRHFTPRHHLRIRREHITTSAAQLRRLS